MSFFKGTREPAGIAEVFALAFPIIISQGCDSIMLFTDRLFLSQLSVEHLSAALTGGLCAHLIGGFHIGLLNQTTSFVAQYLGRGQYKLCSLPTNQSVLLLLISLPFLIISALIFGPGLLAMAGHTARQTELEITYFKILCYSLFFSLGRVLLASFFSGIGRTSVVMFANILAVVINIPLSYGLIHGKILLPQMGMSGAAWATFISSAISFIFLISVYLSKGIRDKYFTLENFAINQSTIRRILRFGSPSGIEYLLQISGFTFFVIIMHSLGKHAAAATTITFNWDLLAFLPLVGMQIATMSLTGRYIGSGRLDLAEKACRTALKMALLYALFCSFIYLTFTDQLIEFFIQENAHNPEAIMNIARPMLYLACLYLPADCFFLVFGGGLKGSGDTFFTMVSTTIAYWTIVALAFVAVKYFHFGPVQVWAIFVIGLIFLSITFFLRYQKGPWRKISMVEHS